MPFRFLVPAVLLIASVPACSASLSAPDRMAVRGQAAVVSLTFSSEGQSISGIQFDFEWDDTLDLKLVVGDSLRGSSKLLYTAPQGQRGIRCIIIGADGAAVPEGVLLKAFLIVDPQASAGKVQLRITNTAATDQAGNSTALKPAAVNIEVADSDALFVSVPAEGILNAASLLPGAIAPGEIITLLGSLPAETATLLVNGLPAPILYSGPNQVNAIVPFGTDLAAPANIEVKIGNRTASLSVPVAPVAPAIFTQNATGVGPGAILNQDYSLNSAVNAAPRGSTVMLFGTGFGAVNPPAADGQIADAAAPTKLGVTAVVGGRPAIVSYAGAAPGLIAGVAQINVEIPFDAEPSPTTPVLVYVGSAASPAGITIAVR